MSGGVFPSGASILAGQALGLIQQIFFRTRSIGGFVANVTLEERHMDEIRITDHPVERGSMISDHAFKMPERVTIRVGYSNSTLEAFGNPNYVNEVYAQFLAMQASLEPITILTGKRLYQNMMIERLAVVTDEKTENALLMTCDCREVQIVDTVTVNQAPAQDQTNPESTAGISNNGSASVLPATGSTLSSSAGGFLGYQPSAVSIVPIQPTPAPTGSGSSSFVNTIGIPGGLG